MTEKLKVNNPEFNKFFSNIMGMDFFELCSEALLEEKWDTLDVICRGLMLLDERYTSEDITGTITDEERISYCKFLEEDFPLELQLELYNATQLLADAFRDDEEAELLSKENLPMVIKAASVFGKYEEANGGDFYEFVCEFLEDEKEIATLVDVMTEYFGLEHEEKIDDSMQEYTLSRLKEEAVKYLPERFFK